MRLPHGACTEKSEVLAMVLAFVTPLFAEGEEGLTLEGLDKRVSELEKFSFGGLFVARFGFI